MSVPEIQRLLDCHKSLSFDKNTQKVKCNLTNHEMPAKVSAIESYVSGKKYKRLSDLEALDYEGHKMHIVPSSKKDNELFCRLTIRHLENTAKAIQRHINGRKYKNSLARWNECQKTGTKFVAHIRRKAKGPDESDNDSVVSNESDDDANIEEDAKDDDMSDLYPEADFQEKNGSGEGMEVEDNVPIENVPPKIAKTKTKNKKKVGEENKGATSNSTSKVKKGKSNDDKSKSSSAEKRSTKQKGKEHVVKKKIKK